MTKSLFHGIKYNYNEKLNNKVLNQNTQMWKYSEQLSHTGSCSSSPLSQLGLWSIRMVAIIAYISKAKYNHLKLKVLLQWAAKENT